MMRTPASLTLLVLALCACSDPTENRPARDLDALALEYLVLELSVARHDPSHVDAYFGPEALREEAEEADLSLEDIGLRVKRLREELSGRLGAPAHDREQARIEGLLARLRATDTRLRLQLGEKFSFDEESERLFGARAPDYGPAHFEAVLAKIDALLPGEEPLDRRVETFRAQFAIPDEALAAVIDAAIGECRRRSLRHIELHGDESFRMEFVTDKPWSGYNWYQGNAQSLIQINTDLPVYISRAVDLGCHEGYPGHHAYNALLEEHVVNGQGWIEFSLYPLFSPQSFIAEGSANYGIDMAFPDDERIRFEQEVLFPLAGLDASEAGRYYELLDLLAELDYASNEAARDYLDGVADREATIDWLVKYALESPEEAYQSTTFFDTYRSYVINYSVGRDRVAAWVERDAADADLRWARFAELLSTATLPSDLE